MYPDMEIVDAILSCDFRKLMKLNRDNDFLKAFRSEEGLNLLHVAGGIVSADIIPIVSYLLQIGVDPNARCLEGLTPVHIACIWNNLYVLRQLLIFGGDPFLCDHEQVNAFDMASQNEAKNCYDLLKNLSFRGQKNDLLPIEVTLQIMDLKNGRKKSNGAIEKTVRKTESDIGKSSDGIEKAIPKRLPKLIEPKDSNLSHSHLNTLDKCELSKLNKSADKNVSVRSRTKRWIKEINSLKSNLNVSGSNSESVLQNYEDGLCTNVLNCGIGNKDVIVCNDLASSSCASTEYVSLPSDTITLDSDIEIEHTDKSEGIVLIEKWHRCSANRTIIDISSSSTCSSKSDWKAYKTAYSSFTSSSSTETVNGPVAIPEDLQNLSNSDIYSCLRELGDNPGPVQDSTRLLYLQRLAKLKSGIAVLGSSMKYSAEIHMYLEKKLDMSKLKQLEYELAKDFDERALLEKCREGNRRCSFNYFLLDPRVTKNLPMRVHSLTTEETFNIFIDALFYVGKGTKGRPYAHFYEAAKANTQQTNELSAKVKHILDIWQPGLGVLSLHCFQNSIPIEAFTIEACIIEALGLQNLTNILRGNFYGKSVSWTMTKKRQLGVLFLSKALEIFLLEGERQIRPKDVNH